ncbi:hypothetical protein MF672_005105 [Actinomadura sp. ATCC 31491]|uniref:Anti-sigma factor n=1 Tax=Actinomadura luzonensis TaxID=2805427 RepID=A0ABT0FLG9_9ACTN|nr:hypothetical protein [Actinomadura luzonensis]MCK2213176.1 hypothetical protein [Actinomadura luzonensis]
MSSFEERLLSALKSEITTRTADDIMTTTATPPMEQARTGRGRRLGFAVAGVAAAAAAVVALGGTVFQQPAYAVTKAADGTVDVRISAFTDPGGLAAELGRNGVKAVVDYLPEGQTCQAVRGRPADLAGRFSGRIGRSGDGISFAIMKGQVPAGATLVLAVTKSKDGDDRPPTATSLSVVQGEVAPCAPTSLPLPSSGGGGTDEGKKDDGPSLRTHEGDGPGLNEETG